MLLILKTGDAALPVRRQVGDYDRWFAPYWRASGVRGEVLPVHAGARLGSALQRPRWDGLLITGSPLSLVRPAEWMRRLAGELREACERGIPVLGVCFGHQLLAYAFDTPVIVSPKGREIGTVDVTLTPAGRRDPLWEGSPTRFSVQATHEDVPAELPRGAVALATNAHGLQAMRIAKNVRSVQYHPELSPEGMAGIIRARSATLSREGKEPTRLLAGVRPTPFASRLLETFLSQL